MAKLLLETAHANKSLPHNKTHSTHTVTLARATRKRLRQSGASGRRCCYADYLVSNRCELCTLLGTTGDLRRRRERRWQQQQQTERQTMSVARKKCYLELRPIHRHVDSVVVGPPFDVLLLIGVVDCVVKLFVNLR